MPSFPDTLLNLDIVLTMYGVLWLTIVEDFKKQKSLYTKFLQYANECLPWGIKNARTVQTQKF